MVLRRVGTPKKIVSETEPAYEERAVWVEVDSSGNIINQYVGFFDEWILIDTNANFPVHFDFLQSSQPALDAGKSWLEVTSFVTNTIDTPTTGSNIYEFDISSTDDVFNVNSVTVLGNSSSTSRGPVTITDSGSATVDPQGTRVENANVTFVGEEYSTQESVSGSGTISTTQTVNVGGNLSPTGPENGNPRITVTGVLDEVDQDVSDESIGSSVGDRGRNTVSTSPTITDTFSTQIRQQDDVNSDIGIYLKTGYNTIQETVDNGIYLGERYTYGLDSTITFDNLNIETNGQPVTIVAEVMRIGNWDSDKLAPKWQYSSFYNTTHTLSSKPSNYDVFTDTGESFGMAGGSPSQAINLDGVSEVTIEAQGKFDYSIEWTENYQTIDPSLTVDGETVSHTGALTDGEIATKNLTSLTPGSHTANVSVSGPVSTTVNWTDITETVDPTISVNGNTAGYNGVLTSGDSANIDIEKSWLISGTNTLELISGSPASLILEYDEVDTSGQTTVRLYFSDGNNWYEL